jgi:hypothetical protein
MKRKTCLPLTLLVLTVGIFLPRKALAAGTQHVYYGSISDSMCRAKHMMSGNMHQCTMSCVKGGAKFVFVTGGRAVKIANQNFAALRQYAGEHVKVTGTRSGGSITITHIAPVAARKKN